jgi:hypothetical protein
MSGSTDAGGSLDKFALSDRKNTPMAMSISAVASKLIETEERASPGTILVSFAGFLFGVTCLVLMV